MRYRAPRGTQDILPEAQALWRYVTARAEGLANHYGYRRIDTPVFEQAGLFTRSVGAGTDIVEKETYTFPDRGDEELTLRPEGTAPVCRAYLERGMGSWPQPVRLYYFCPIFRYDRPQSGRYRQHHQFGVEAIGDGDPAVDAEVIELGWRLTGELGLQDLDLLLNSIGCIQCRPAYLEALRNYYRPRVERGEVCSDCRLRFQHNVLRMLDCKRTDFSCQPLADAAPASIAHICHDCAEHWDTLRYHLGFLEVPFQVTHRLVRGLDYYTRTVFEIQPRGVEGAQSTVLAGGRYDHLIEELGGAPTPGIGFGSGIERWVLNVQRQELAVPPDSGPDAVVVAQSPTAREEALRLASQLRREGLQAVLAPQGRSLRGQMRHATALKARYALILGETELVRGTVQVKLMSSGKQREVEIGKVRLVRRKRA